MQDLHQFHHLNFLTKDNHIVFVINMCDSARQVVLPG